MSLQLFVLPCLWKRNLCKYAFFCDHMCRLQKCVRQAIFSLSIRNIVSRLVVSLGTAAELVYTVHSLITKCWYAVIILHTEYSFRMFAGLQTQTFPSISYWHLLLISSPCTFCIWLYFQNKVHRLLFHIHYYFLRRRDWHLWCFRLTELIMVCQIWMTSDAVSEGETDVLTYL